jgi:hypothetical protein
MEAGTETGCSRGKGSQRVVTDPLARAPGKLRCIAVIAVFSM